MSPIAHTYLDAEHERLERVAALTDPATIRYLEQIGVGEGWQCAEVGAGSGSIARWLSNRVGHFGRVEAIDIELMPEQIERLNKAVPQG